MADENHTQMLIQQQPPPPPQQQNQMQQPQLQQQQMQPQQQMQQQPQQQAQAMSMGNTSDQQANHMNVTTSVPINVATINVSQAQQMQTMQQNVNTSSGTTVQMVPQLTAQAQTVQTGNMMSQSSGPHPTMIHPTMTMAQSPLQQVQVIQQPLSASYLQHLYTPQQQMLFPGNLTLQHAGMTTPIQNLGATQGLSLQLQAKTTLDAKTSVGGQALQAVNTSNKGMAVNAGTMMTASGQVVGTTPKSNFPQQMMTTPGKSTIIHSQSGFAPANANQTVVIGQLGVLPNQQSIFNHKALADSQKGKTYTFHNQQAALQPKSLYSSSLPVHSTAQVFNGSHLKQITSQPQIITTQAGTMLGQAQFLGSLQALGSLPQGISWATPGCLQSSTLLTQNPIIIRSQQSDMFIQSPPQTAMHLPVAAATAPVPPTTCTPLAPQKPKQVRSGTQTVAVATQTVVSSAATVNSNATPIRTQIRPKSKLPTGSSPGASPSPVAPQMATTQTQTSQSHSQPQNQPAPQQKSDAANQTHSNQVKPVVPVASETKSTATQSKSIAVETKPLPPSLPVKSHAMVAPSTKIVQTTVSSTIGISTITSSSSTTPVSCAPVTTTATTANASTSVSAAVNTSPVLPYTPPASTNIVPEDVCPADDDTKPVSTPEESVEPVAHQTEPIEVIESEPLKPQQPITKLPLGNVKEKLQKAIVKPQVLTHVIDGFVIQEGPEPFPVSRSSLLSDSTCKVIPTEKPKRTEDSPIAASPEKKMKIHRPRGNVELAKCEFCGKMGPKSKFKRSKRFCSTSCAKRYNVCCSKRVGLLPSAVQENVAAGPGRKRKAGFKGRKGLRKQSQNENEEVNSTQLEENTKCLKDESVLPVKMEDNNIEPAEDNPCPVVIQSEKEEEMEVVKSESEVIRKLPNKWSVQEVFQFICDLPGCSDYADEFRSQEIDGQALLLLKEDHLMNAMNMKLGPALKLISQINSIKEELSHS